MSMNDTDDQTEQADCDFELDLDPAPSPRAMEHFLDTGCTAGDEPGHFDDSPSHIASPKTVPSMSTLALVPPLPPHDHSWTPVPNDCGFYACLCGWYGRRELSDGTMTARPTLRRLKRVPDWECTRCGTNRDVDRNIGYCAACWAIEWRKVR